MTANPVIFSREELPAGFIGCAQLNQPATLNSIGLEMIELLTAQLTAWKEDEACLAVYLTGAGERAFCAGGDIQALYHSMVQGTDYCQRFFSAEYRLDHLIRFFPRPVVCVGHGVIMGGGLGLLAGSSHRVVTAAAKVALPEITIGLFPDASTTFYLASMPRYLADFIALTGSRLSGQDAVMVGLADYVLAQGGIDQLLKDLKGLDWQADPQVNHSLLHAVLRSRNLEGEGNLAEVTAVLRRLEGLLAAQGPAAYLSALKREAGEATYLASAADNLASGCPVTAWIIREQLHRAVDMDYSSMLRMEFNIATACTVEGDFQEGVRALLIDKDRQPRWRFPDLEQVPPAQVAQHFAEVEPHPLQDLVDG